VLTGHLLKHLFFESITGEEIGMGYIILFLEGMITFISPCLLPMLPIYVSYFAGGTPAAAKKQPLANAIGFVLGFTVIFVMLGAFAGIIGQFLQDYRTAVNITAGLIVIIFGLNYLGVLQLRIIPDLTSRREMIKIRPLTFFSSILFGMMFSIFWTPCVSAFLGAALLRASQQGSMTEGMFMLFVFSMGLGLPFIVSAVLIDHLKDAFSFIKKHYRIINAFSGGLLVLVGILMMAGIFGRFLALFL